MGLIEKLMRFVFGGGVQSTVEVFRENSEKSAVRAHVLQQAALTQFATEFRNPRSGFDRFIDGVNRLPRPNTNPISFSINPMLLSFVGIQMGLGESVVACIFPPV